MNESVAAAAAPVAAAQEAVAAPQRLVEEGGARPPARQRRSRMRYSAAVEKIRRTPAALRSALTRATQSRSSSSFLGSEEEASMQEALQRKSAKAGVLAAAVRQRADAEASFARGARLARPENVLAPARQIIRPPPVEEAPRQRVLFPEENEFSINSFTRGLERE